MDITKLSDAQLLIADKVIKAATAQGLDPDYALAHAFAESAFNPTAAAKGKDTHAYGVMQLQPGTAKELGVDPQDEDQNIQGGVTYLKQQLEKYGGDKLKASLAYHAGPGAADEFLKTGDSKLLTDADLKYLDKLQVLHDFGPTPKAEEPSIPGVEIKPEPSEHYAFEKGQDAAAAGAGAATGAALGSAYSLGKGAAKAVHAVQDLPGAIEALGAKLTPAGGLVPTDPQNIRMGQGTTVEDLTGRARQTAYNEQTAATAARQKEAAKIIEQLKQQGIVTGNVQAKLPGMTSTPGGILLPQSAVYENAQAAEKAAALAAEQSAKNAPGPLARAGSKVLVGADALMRSPVLRGALGAAGAGGLGAEALQRYGRGDLPGAAAAGVGALGSLASMVPGPVGVTGTIASVLGPTVLSGMDNYRNNPANFNIPPATPQELEAAQKPAFGRYPNPARRKSSPLQILGGLQQELSQQAAQFSAP